MIRNIICHARDLGEVKLGRLRGTEFNSPAFCFEIKLSPTVRIIVDGHGARFVELYMINGEVEWIGERDILSTHVAVGIRNKHFYPKSNQKINK